MSEHHYHAVIWIDHREARVFHFNPSDVERLVLHPDHPTKNIHHKANSIGSGHASPDKEFLAQVTSALSDAGEVLIIGPAGAKTELAKYLREQHPAIGERIVAVEAADHPTDREIVAYAKRHFRMAPARVATRG